MTLSESNPGQLIADGRNLHRYRAVRNFWAHSFRFPIISELSVRKGAPSGIRVQMSGGSASLHITGTLCSHNLLLGHVLSFTSTACTSSLQTNAFIIQLICDLRAKRLPTFFSARRARVNMGRRANNKEGLLWMRLTECQIRGSGGRGSAMQPAWHAGPTKSLASF